MVEGAHAVDGLINNKRVPEGTTFILSKPEPMLGRSDYTLFSSEFSDIELKDNIASLDVVSETSTTGGGVQGAAGGAVLGFLIAGPLGTVLGAGIGSKKKGADNITIAVKFFSGEQLVLRSLAPPLLNRLKDFHISSSFSKTNRLANKPKKEREVKSKAKKKTASKISPPLSIPAIKKGRSKLEAKLPTLPIIESWSKKSGDDEKAYKVFFEILNNEVKEYNNFKWRYFDKYIESDNEIILLAQQLLQNLVQQSKRIKTLEKKLSSDEKAMKTCEDTLKRINSELQILEKDLDEVSFFKVRGVKKQIQEINLKVFRQDYSFNKYKRSLSDNKEKYDDLLKIRNLDNPEQKFKNIATNLFSNEFVKSNLKKPKEKKFSNQTFFQIYKNSFVEIETKKRKETEEKESKKSSSKDKTKSPTSSTKKRLLELKGLFDEELISKNEYETKRKKILENL